jgi:ribosome biogenesis GTPase
MPSAAGSMNLSDLGWDAGFAEAFAPFEAEGFEPARVAARHRTGFELLSPAGPSFGELSGRLHHQIRSAADMPVVGDWVAASGLASEGSASIHDLLPRRTRFSRKVAGERSEEQVLAANLDRVFVVSGLDRDFNLRRLERFLVLAAAGGIEPVVVLNKIDLADDLPARLAEVARITPGIELLLMSARTGEGVEALRAALPAGRTGALIGSSGVGKSTLINRLLGQERQTTGEVRASDGRGRHVTSVRELLPIPGAGLLIDNPGLREVQLWAGEEDLAAPFTDVIELAAGCRFRDCRHQTEPGCAVLAAVEEGRLEAARLESYRKLQKEIAFQERRRDPILKDKEEKRIARLIKQVKKLPKQRS